MPEFEKIISMFFIEFTLTYVICAYFLLGSLKNYTKQIPLKD